MFVLSTSNRISLTVVRLVLGGVMFAHGAQKVFGAFGGGGLDATLDFFTGQVGLPYWLAVLVVVAEFGGSLALITGFLTRLGALGIACVMCGAIAKVHAPNGFFMNWYGSQSGEGYEFHLLAIAMAVVLLIEGGGALSLDRAITGRRAAR